MDIGHVGAEIPNLNPQFPDPQSIIPNPQSLASTVGVKVVVRGATCPGGAWRHMPHFLLPHFLERWLRQ